MDSVDKRTKTKTNSNLSSEKQTLIDNFTGIFTEKFQPSSWEWVLCISRNNYPKFMLMSPISSYNLWLYQITYIWVNYRGYVRVLPKVSDWSWWTRNSITAEISLFFMFSMIVIIQHFLKNQVLRTGKRTFWTEHS